MSIFFNNASLVQVYWQLYYVVCNILNSVLFIINIILIFSYSSYFITYRNIFCFGVAL